MTVFLHGFVLLKEESFCYLKRLFCTQETLLGRTGRGVSKKVISKMQLWRQNKNFIALYTLPRLQGKWRQHPGGRSRIALLLSMFHHPAWDTKQREGCESNPITLQLDPAEGSRWAATHGNSSSNISYRSGWAQPMCQALCWEPYAQYLL